MSKGNDWRWPRILKNIEKIVTEIKEIDSPYEPKDDKPIPICYPGTHLSKSLLGRATKLLAKQINSIGSHTHIKKNADGSICNRASEGGFDQVHQMEAGAIFLVASVLGGSPFTVDGYFCGGGTEANIEGMWVGREWLRNTPDPKNKGIAVLTTPLFHYSIGKASEILDLGAHQYLHCPLCECDHLFMPDPTGSGMNMVGMDKNGQMSIAELKKVFKIKYNEGFRRFMIVPTVGTSVMGSIDPIEEIGKFIQAATRETGANFYMHVDASFGGFTVPFVKPDMKFAFNVPQVMSVTVDADKMGHLPYPAGIFLCRKNLMSLVGRKVNYIRGNKDDTVSGSRSCLAPVLAYYTYQTLAIDDQKKYVKKCLNMRDFLVQKMKESLPWVKILPCSPYVNFAPMVIPIDQTTKNIPNALMEKLDKPIPGVDPILEGYHLRSDFVPKDPANVLSCPHTVYKICIMPHHTEQQMLNFVNDIARADEMWKKHKSLI
ncbi:MAG: pyridoxal-dependent decarboxylase [Parcubacteria group bacterium]